MKASPFSESDDSRQCMRMDEWIDEWMDGWMDGREEDFLVMSVYAD